jgi:hypothetical protein
MCIDKSKMAPAALFAASNASVRLKASYSSLALLGITSAVTVHTTAHLMCTATKNDDGHRSAT